MLRSLKSLAVLLALIAVFAVSGCAPSISDQLQAGLPDATPRPTTMTNEVGKDADAAASALMDASVKVRVDVPERRIEPSRTASGTEILGVYVKPISVDMIQSERRFVGFKVISQEPAAGASLPASQTVVLTVGSHPSAVAGATWYATHPADIKRKGDGGCIGGANGTGGCHTQSYCASCHDSAIKAAKLGKP